MTNRPFWELAFHSGGIYCYFGVPAQIYHELLRAKSKGRYFNSHIRNRFNFNFTRLRDAAEASLDN